MRIQFITDDEKIFETREAAEKHESEIKDVEDQKKVIIDKVSALDKKIDSMKEELYKLLDERDDLLNEYKEKFMSPGQQKLIDSIESLVNHLLGDD